MVELCRGDDAGMQCGLLSGRGRGQIFPDVWIEGDTSNLDSGTLPDPVRGSAAAVRVMLIDKRNYH